MTLSPDTVLIHSPDVAARLVGGRVVLAPLHADAGDPLDDLFTLNATGQAIWELIDGSRPLRDVVGGAATRFDAAPDDLLGDLLAFVEDLVAKGMLDTILTLASGTPNEVGWRATERETHTKGPNCGALGDTKVSQT